MHQHYRPISQGRTGGPDLIIDKMPTSTLQSPVDMGFGGLLLPTTPPLPPIKAAQCGFRMSAILSVIAPLIMPSNSPLTTILTPERA